MKLTFNLDSGTSTLLGGDGSAYNFANPIVSGSVMNVLDDGLADSVGELKFSTGAPDIIQLNDLTGDNSLQLSLAVPYLLIHASSNAAYTGLITTGGTMVVTINGTDYVVPANGFVENLTVQTEGGFYYATRIYLYNGNLEVVPEPGTWALMIGGLALLIFLQRRRSNN